MSTEKRLEEEAKEKQKQAKKEIRLKETAEFLKNLIKKPTKTPEEVQSSFFICFHMLSERMRSSA